MFLFKNQLDSVDDSIANANDSFEAQNQAAKKLADEGLQAVKQKYDDILGKVASLISESQSLPSFKASRPLQAG